MAKEHANSNDQDNKQDNSEEQMLNNDLSEEQSDDDQNPFGEEFSTEKNTLDTLKQQLDALKSKADRNYDLALRAKAELDNVRKRTDQEVTNAHKFALERFIPELFPLLDGLDQGLHTLPTDEQFDSVRDGLTLSVKMFRDTLTKFGVEILDPVNAMFDPSQHEAISMQPSNDVAAGTVLVVVQKGFVLNNRVLRPARVVVAKASE